MADFSPDDQELTAPFEEEIADFLQADLNLRPVDWANSSAELLNDDENIVVENICETVVEEIILEQENENYLTGLEGNCMENSIGYLFEDPVADYSLDEPEFVIEESLTYDLEPLETNLEETQVGDTMDSNSSQDITSKSETPLIEENVNEHENVVQETLVENSVNNFVNSTSDSDSVKSTSLRDNIDSELKNDSEVLCSSVSGTTNLQKSTESLACTEPDQESSQSFDMKDDFEVKLAEFQSPKVSRFSTNSDSPASICSSYTPRQQPCLLEKVNSTDKKLNSSSNAELENSPSTSSTNNVKVTVLGKEQIKKRLQSFSLMKQGIQPLPIKKIINKLPKIQVQLQNDTYDELGNKIEEKLVIIKKPPKQGPTPQDRARAVIDEIEQIKREEQLIYEENLSFMTNSMREAIKKSKKNANVIDGKYFDKEKSYERKDRKYDKDYSKSRNRRSLEKERGDKKKSKPRDESAEKSREPSNKDDEKKIEEQQVPQTWEEVKLKNMDFKEISFLKEKMLKSFEKNSKKEQRKFQEEEKIYPFKREDFVKPQLMFEEPSLLRNPLLALSIQGTPKYFPPEVIKFTEKFPIVSYCENPLFSSDFLKPRKVIFNENPPERNDIMMKIVEGKTGILNKNNDKESESNAKRNWYPQNDYLNETIKSMDSNDTRTNALLVLSEMYDDEDDLESDKDRHKRRQKQKLEGNSSKLKKKKSKKKKRKSKSKSRSHSQENRNSKRDDKDGKKAKPPKSKSEEKNESLKNATVELRKITKDTFDDDDKVENREEDKGTGGENTPNTEEYRSNWESEEDILDIIPVEDQFSKNAENSLDQNWEFEEFKDRRKSRRSRSLSTERVHRKRNYNKSSYLIDLELEEKNKRSTDDDDDDDDNKQYSNRISLDERDKKSIRTSRNNSSDEKKKNKWSTSFEIDNKIAATSETARNIKNNKSKDYKNEGEQKSRRSQEEIKKLPEPSRDNDHKSTTRESREKSKIFAPEMDIHQNINYKDKSRFPEDHHHHHGKKNDDQKPTIPISIPEESEFKGQRDRDPLNNNNSSSNRSSRRPDSDRKPSKDRNVSEEKMLPRSRRDSKENKITLDENRPNIVDVEEKSSSAYNKWSSEEDLHNKRKPCFAENQIKLNLNYSRRSQWSDDEDYERKKFIRESLEKDKKESSKSLWEDDLEAQCRHLEAEIQKKKELLNYKNIEELKKYKKDDESKKYKKKSNERKSEETYKNRGKLHKKKNREDKYKPKITINYSDFEDSIEAQFTEKKVEVAKPPKDPLFDANEIFTKYKAKIKIDYTDFDLSLNECKGKFDTNSIQKTTAPEQTTISSKLSMLDEENLSPEKPKEIILTAEPTIKNNTETTIITDITKQTIDFPISIIPISEITPVVLPISKPIIEPIIPTVVDPSSKLVSEYEEFIKAVCFEDTKEDVPIKTQEPPEATIVDVIEKDLYNDDTSSSSSNSSSSSSSSSSNSNNSSSEEISDSSDDDNSSISELSEMNEKIVLETVANIKTEILSDSESEYFAERITEKRKRNDLSECDTEYANIIVKQESDKQHPCKKSKITNSDFDQTLIEWESSLTSKTMSADKSFQSVHQSEIDVFDIAPSSVLPENIPLPQDNIFQLETTRPTPNDFMYNQSSPKRETYSISSESHTPSPVKQSFIVAEVRKQTNSGSGSGNTLNLSGCEQFDLNSYHDEKSLYHIVSSSDASNAESTITNVIGEIPDNDDDDDDGPSLRKRQSQWNLNLIPAKKPLLQNSAPEFNQEDSDDDFTSKTFGVKHLEKDKSLPPNDQLNVSRENIDVQQRTVEAHKSKDSEKARESLDKPSSEPSEKVEQKVDKDRAPRTSSNDRKNRKGSVEHKQHDKNRGDRTTERSREQSPNNSRVSKDREHRELQRDRDKRRSNSRQQDRRLPERKSGYAKGARNRYSRDRSPIRSRSVGQDRTTRDRSKDRGRGDRRDFRDKRDFDRSRGNYRRDKYSRSPSPNRANMKQDYHRPPSSRARAPDDTDFSTHSMDLVHSPINSPLDGFKRSLADSTISDSELLTQQITPDECEQSPGYSQLPKPYYHHLKELPIRRLESPGSPKRISLDDRINLVLGIEKEPPKSIDTVCSRGPFTNTVPNYQHHDPYGYPRHDYELYNAQSIEQYHHHHHQPHPPGPYHNPYPQATYYQNPITTENNLKVVQVGNVIQVVPTEQPIVSPVAPPVSVAPIPPVAQPVPITSKSNELPPKVVQVGNMLQIVPMTIMDMTATTTTTTTTTIISTSPLATTAPSTPIPDAVAAPKPIDQLVLERRAEKEKRRQEREQRRQEKEKKRKEKEKRKQLKIKLKTENMIKRALMLETGEEELDISNIEPDIAAESTDLPAAWPPSNSTILSLPLPKPPTKGILVSHGFREKDDSMDEIETRKVVKFADGICPGEGTSPSAGEELPSPPPPPRKLPKEKRYKKVKLSKGKNKKKVKVKIIRKQQPPTSDSSDTEDNLPPPPPPPGSPPSHLWPPRIKQPPVNNIHPQLNIPGSNAPVYPPPGPAYVASPQMGYPGGYPPSVVMGQPSMSLIQGPGPNRSHHPPVIPVLQSGAAPIMTSHHGTHHGTPSYH